MRKHWLFCSAAMLWLCGLAAAQQPQPATTNTATNLVVLEGQRALRQKDFAAAKALFARYTQAHPQDAAGRAGLGDAEVGLHAYAAAEVEYRAAVLAEPMLWSAHRALVLVEAKLGRWEDFDRERALLRAARERGAEGIARRDADVIDSFAVHGQQWVVREYFEPLGRTHARINFESFSAAGRVLEYVSLEDGQDGALALDWADGKGHGTVRNYAQMPQYRSLRRDVVRWLERTDSGRAAAGPPLVSP